MRRPATLRSVTIRFPLTDPDDPKCLALDELVDVVNERSPVSAARKGNAIELLGRPADVSRVLEAITTSVQEGGAIVVHGAVTVGEA